MTRSERSLLQVGPSFRTDWLRCVEVLPLQTIHADLALSCQRYKSIGRSGMVQVSYLGRNLDCALPSAQTRFR